MKRHKAERNGEHGKVKWFAVLSIPICAALIMAGRAGQAAQAQPAQAPAPIRVRVNVVEVRVVVRDEHGQPVANLKREDFQLYDDGKPQSIANFTVETPEVRSAEAATSLSGKSASALMPASAPERFVALVFDDTHLSSADLMFARNSATAFLDGLGPGDRVGVYSISGSLNHNLTADKNELKQALAGLSSHFAMVSRQGDCPKVSYYLANQVDTLGDQTAFRQIVADALHCAYGDDPKMRAQAEMMARNAVQQAMSLGQADNNQVYDQLMAIVKWMEIKPGRRIVLFISPGVSLTNDKTRLQRVVEEANRQGIVINTLDARGVFTDSTYSSDVGAPQKPRAMALASQEAREQMDLLINLADGTGGTHFLSSNDIAGGMKQLGDEPSITYILTFSPAAAKGDGSFHKLKVELTGKRHYQIVARNGYYDEKTPGDSKQRVQEEVRKALYSGAKTLDMPMDLKLAAVKSSTEERKIQISLLLSIKDIPFRKEQDRDCNVLLTSVAIFDDDGNFVMKGEKELELRLTAPTYEKFLNSGVPNASGICGEARQIPGATTGPGRGWRADVGG